MAESQYDLVEAIKDGDVGRVKRMLRESRLSNQSQLMGHLLLIAIEEDQEDVVKLLCQDGLWDNVFRSDDLSPLLVAAKYGNVAIIETLLRHGAGVNDQSPEHRLTALLMATRWRQKDAVCHLLDSGADANLSSGRFKQMTTPLHEAVLIGHEDIVNLLLAGGADVNAVDGQHKLPLHILCESKYRDSAGSGPKIVRRLLDCGSKVNVVDCNGNTLLHQAIRKAHQNGGQEVIRQLCVAGVPINLQNDEGDTALHLVCQQEEKVQNDSKMKELQLEVARALVQFSPKLTVENHRCSTPLQNALLASFNLPLVELLIDSGSDMNHINQHGQTIFHAICERNGSEEAVRFLLRRGVKYDTVCHKGLSPLTAACNHGSWTTALVLCQEAPALLQPSRRIQDVRNRPLSHIATLMHPLRIEYILRAGYRWTQEEIEYLADCRTVWRPLRGSLRGLVEHPPVLSLEVICRDVIRIYLRDCVWEKVQQLPLPTKLKDHLLLANVWSLPSYLQRTEQFFETVHSHWPMRE